MADHRAQVDELLADYRRSRDQLAEVHRELGAISASVANADGTVTATVGARGTLTGLTITDEAYQRFRPAELAAEIVRIAGAATVKALAGAGEVLAPALPAGTDPQALLLGTADLTAAEVSADVPAAGPRPRDEDVSADDFAARAEEDSFEDQNWVTRTQGPDPR
ncbi:hypothetical protein CFN78_02515 [Amycolatopsis antarctica]|uniref:YbaB/EbfC family DNA-binding protein n=1 Tax=Amycolatopsis antarctica TaxID=1854586 RepID=A0A263DAE2_9PSEU|nr:YbaB/EbfC family nucleoid-associated protein [Amycolatopsis antarctica]OZM75321.1 hypothetical protein CFN78_02515 [Amycolatopsis antarctica]